MLSLSTARFVVVICIHGCGSNWLRTIHCVSIRKSGGYALRCWFPLPFFRTVFLFPMVSVFGGSSVVAIIFRWAPRRSISRAISRAEWVFTLFLFLFERSKSFVISGFVSDLHRTFACSS